MSLLLLSHSFFRFTLKISEKNKTISSSTFKKKNPRFKTLV